jgi:hypothetical protein
MTNNDFENVVQTYFAMQKSIGLSVEAAIKKACEATGRAYNKKYLSTWPPEKIGTIPDEVIAWMQLTTGNYAFEMAGVKVSRAKVIEIVKSLSVPVKK